MELDRKRESFVFFPVLWMAYIWLHLFTSLGVWRRSCDWQLYTSRRYIYGNMSRDTSSGCLYPSPEYFYLQLRCVYNHFFLHHPTDVTIRICPASSDAVLTPRVIPSRLSFAWHCVWLSRQKRLHTHKKKEEKKLGYWNKLTLRVIVK